ncbi:MAG: hypothetical protein ABJN36_20450 [Cyclobacteriaceae bacterium]
MSWKNQSLLFIGLTVAVLIGCDSFEDDMEPKKEDQLDLKNSISSLAGVTVFVDLKQRIKTSQEVKFGIGIAPTQGTAEISSNAILTYVPQASFVSGSDFLSLNLFDAAGGLVDTDSIYFTIADSVGALPCFNGALSDYYFAYKNEPLIFRPINNDGYCVDETSGAIINFESLPENGTVENVELFTFKYTPEQGFIGTEQFMYQLELIDSEGNSETSLAQISIEVIEYQDSSYFSCDSLIYQPVFYQFSEPKEDFYFLSPVEETSFCGWVGEWDVDLISVENGSAEVTETGYIKYFPGESETDRIDFQINLSSETVVKYMLIEFADSDKDCNDPIVAVDDSYDLYIVEDSIGNSNEPYELHVTQNDTHCSNYSLEIIEAPTIGQAEAVWTSDGAQSSYNYMIISYYSDEEFAGTKTTEFVYTICEDAECDTASVYLNVIK